jgi:hypothetical protein
LTLSCIRQFLPKKKRKSYKIKVRTFALWKKNFFSAVFSKKRSDPTFLKLSCVHLTIWYCIKTNKAQFIELLGFRITYWEMPLRPEAKMKRKKMTLKLSAYLHKKY